MRVEILGSGGATTTPRPGCSCRVCTEAREKGSPYSRTGPSAFVHGPGLLFDTPEEIKLQLNRAGISDVAACVYSHWHPDHVMGRRVFETMNADFRTWPRDAAQQRATPVYVPEQVAADFRTYLGSWEHLEFMHQRGWIEIVELADGQTFAVDGTMVTPFRLREEYVYAFVLTQGAKRLLLAMDELNGWEPPEWVKGVDLAVLPMGICEFDPFTRERRIHPEHPVLRFEATLDETLAMLGTLDAKRVVLSHVEEIDGLTYDDLLRLGEELDVTFAHDGMQIEV